MLASQRIERIREIMLKHKNVDIATLSNELNVSDVTVRKDLEKLEKEGFLNKIHGGAVLVEPQAGFKNGLIDISNYEAKERIAELAFNTIKNGDSIFLGSGTTCYLLAKKISQLSDITVVTNNINALAELVPHIKNVFLLGGEIAYHEGGVILSSGIKGDYCLKDINVNRAFTSITGLDLEAGLTVNRSISTVLYDIVPQITRNWTLMVDHHKFNRIGIYSVASLELIDCIITDEIDEQYREYFQKIGVKIISG